MRRAVATILGTVAGTTLLVGAKLGAPPPVPPPVASSPPAPGPSSAGPPSMAPPTHSAPPHPSPTRPVRAGLRDGTFTGAGSDERYGTITVTITVASGRLTDLSAACGGCGGLSTRISDNAYPTLRQEALTAQSASINTVSGATYTSRGYIASLQSALDQAKG